MNKIQSLAYPAVALLSLAIAVSAHAESPTVDQSASQVWAQAKSRTQVQAELAQARADGSTRIYSVSYNPLLAARSALTREEVKAQARVEGATGYAAAMVGEDSGSFYLAHVPAARDASRVLATAPGHPAR
jgi:hypothetical protein